MKETSDKNSLVPKFNLTSLIIAVLTLFISTTPLHAGSGGNQSIQQFFTTSSDGSEKRQGRFDSRSEVYLHSFKKRRGRKNSYGQNGDYVYQVTTPNGRLLLSSDAAECRIVRVVDGVIVNQLKTPDGRRLEIRDGDDNCQIQDSPDGAAGISQLHDTNTDTYSNAPALAVQLMPFLETTNPGNVYKVWMTPWKKYLRYRGDPFALPTPVCSTNRRKQKCEAGDEILGFARDAGFRRHSSLHTHNFKVTPTSGNQPPTADAGIDQSASLLSLVTLNGSNSSDPDGNQLSYNWIITQIPAGSAATLSDSTASNPSFTIDVAGEYTFSLVVNDGTSNSPSDSVTISTLNSAPTAKAGDDQSKAVGETVTLNGSASNDSDGDVISYLWELTVRPADSSAELSDASSVSPSLILDASGIYEIELTVSDGQLASMPDAIIVSTSNSAPKADAGEDQSATVGTVIQLDASGSTDIDGDSLSYLWAFTDKPANSVSVLSDEGVIRPEFTLDAAGSYTLQLIASDGPLESTDTVTISTVNSAPVADAGIDQSATINSLINLNGSGSTDVDGDSLTYEWALTTVPEDSNAVLSDSNAVMPSFTTDVVGDFVAQLTVSDGELFSEVDTIRISFLNTAPLAEAGPAQSAVIGSTIILDGTGSTDVDFDLLTYNWTLTGPEESEATLLNETSSNPSFTLDVFGEYQIQLEVNDGEFNSLDTVVISTLNSIPVANAGENLDIVAGTTVMLNGADSNDADGDNLTYSWSLSNMPFGSSANITEATTNMPTLVTDLPGIYIAQLIVFDGIAYSDPVTVTITAAATNVAPVADAGTGERVAVGEVVTLDGSDSSDPNGDALTYQWQFTSTPTGSVATLDDATSFEPMFTADLAGDYVIKLIVNDGDKSSSPSEVTITSGNTLTLSLSDTLVGVGRTTVVTATLADPAPAGGQDITLTLDDATLAELDPVTLNFAEGETAVTFSITGLLPGLTVLRGSDDGVAEASATVQITEALVSVDEISLIAPDETTSIVISLSEPAPADGISILLSIVDPGIGTLSTTTVFIAEGEVTPTSNAQVTGVDFGTTTISAQVAGYATDVRDVIVALESSFDATSVNVTTPFTGTITLILDAPAPVSGVTFDLTADDDIVSFVEQVTIPEGQTQSPPIKLTGLSAGSTTLRANSARTIETTTTINIDSTEAYLEGFGQRVTEALIGVDLQSYFRVKLGATPPLPIDIKVSVPTNSGVLLSKSGSIAGSDVVVFDDVTQSNSPAIYIQGTTIGDDVPLTIEITEGNSNNTVPFAIDQVTVDVDPSGLYIRTSDYTTTSFSNNRSVAVATSLLYDSETPDRDGEKLYDQNVRPGITLNVPMKTSDAAIASLESGSTSNISLTSLNANGNYGSTSVTPVSAGEATISIAGYPTGFSLPKDLNLDADTLVDITAPKAALSPNTKIIVGVDLQTYRNLRFDANPPRPVDVKVSVPASSGVLLAKTATESGQKSAMVVTNSTNLSNPYFYIQGAALGDNVPLTIEVFETGTSTPIGYDVQPASVDVDPSGIYINNSDIATTSFSNNTEVRAYTALLYDNESSLPRSGQFWVNQQLRYGISLTIPMLSSDSEAIALPDGATGDITITGGESYGSISVDPQNAGTSTLSVTDLPEGFFVPSDRDVEVIATVTAAEAFLRTAGSASAITETFIGKDLQVQNIIRLTQAPPVPVDVKISTEAASGVLFAKTATAVGSKTLTVSSESVATSHSFYIQGEALGDDFPLTIEVFEAGTTIPVGYDIKTATADVDPSGLTLFSGDINTTTFANNSSIRIRSYLLHDDETPQAIGSLRQQQLIRGGESFTVPLISSDPAIAAAGGATLDASTTSAFGFVDPLTAGISTVFVGSLPGDFVTPTDGVQEFLVTVTAPDIFFGGTGPIIVGDELQVRLQPRLETAPLMGSTVEIMVEVISDIVAIVSDDESQQGNKSIVLPPTSGTTAGYVYVQGLSLDGATQIKVSAPGYNDAVADVQVKKSGFSFYDSGSTLEVGQSRALRVRSFQLNDNNTTNLLQSVRGGVSFDINALSSDLGVGTVISPITFGGGEYTNNVDFTAVSSGNTTVTIQQPTGFSPPAGGTSLEMTVN